MVVLSTLCHSCGFACQQMVLKPFPRPSYLPSKDGVVWLCHLLVNLYIWLTISPCYGSIRLTLDLSLGLIGRDGGLSTLCHSCRFPYQQRVLKTCPGPGYLCSKDGVVWLCYLLVNLHIWVTVSSCYGTIPLTLDLSSGLIGRDRGLNTLCHNCGFPCLQRVLKTFSGPGYFHSKYGVVWLCHL